MQHKHKSSSRNRVIPPEEDMRRLNQECDVGTGNAALLSDALTFAKPEDLKNGVIKVRCPLPSSVLSFSLPSSVLGLHL